MPLQHGVPPTRIKRSFFLLMLIHRIMGTTINETITSGLRAVPYRRVLRYPIVDTSCVQYAESDDNGSTIIETVRYSLTIRTMNLDIRTSEGRQEAGSAY